MSRPTGADKSPQSLIDARRARLLELIDGGFSQEDAVETLCSEGFPSHRLTIWRDIKALQVKWKDANLETYEALVKSQLEALRQMEEGVVLGTVDAETARAWLAIRQEQAKLLGLNSDKDSPTFQLNVKGAKGPRSAVVTLVAPPPRPEPQRGPGPSAPDYIDAEPLQLGAGNPPGQEEREQAQRAEARAELRRSRAAMTPSASRPG